MNCSRIVLVLLVSVIFMAACKSKKPSLAGDDPVELKDFLEFFPEKKAPYTVGDTTLQKKDKDSLLINYKVFTQFVPDSFLQKVFGKTAKPKILPLARIKGDDTYLFAKAVAGEKRAAFIIGYDKKEEFISAMPILQLDQNPGTQQSAVFDNRSTLTVTLTRKNADGSTSDGKNVYVMNNDAKAFTLIMTDALDDKVSEIINPIDTFPRKQKFAADYGSGKMNIFSFRDGRRADRMSFFIHFEKSNGECTGELKGEAIIKSPTKAIYSEGGDPCSLEFNFTAAGLTVKELGGCGSRRGLRCSFDGFYSKKKDPAPKAVKPKKIIKK